jgi:hypothetical protein
VAIEEDSVNMLDARGVAKATRQSRTRVAPTGAFGALRAPSYKGRDDVRVANQDLARRASKEMRLFKRTLPKGVRI